ncbi:MAG TPA: hypothetical protein PLV77_09910, partial [Solirubrobacterales bacterium]|nr:hypothetical protein [Solirubrobacterales bacterium]
SSSHIIVRIAAAIPSSLSASTKMPPPARTFGSGEWIVAMTGAPAAAATVVASLTGTRANDLYKALTGREPRR